MKIETADILFANNPNPMWIYDPKGLSIKQVNEAACALYGFSEKEFLSLTIADLRPVEEISKLEEEVSKQVDRFNNAGIWKHRKKTGELLFVRVLSHPISEEGHQYKLVTAQDVTNKIQYQQELHMLLENSLDGIMLTSPDGRIHRANKAACQMLGMSEEQIKDLGRDGLVHNDEKLQNALKNRNQTGEFSGELTFIHSSGRKIPVELTTSVYRNPQGQLRTSMILRDIHERKEAQTKMLEALQERQRILERISDAFFAVGEDWTVIYWNNQAEKVLGLSRTKVLGNNLWEMFPEAEKLDFFHQYKRAFEEQVPVSFEEYYPPAGAWFEVNGYPSNDGLSVFFRDITDRKQSQVELEQAYKEKETILESIDDGFFTVNRDWVVTYWNSAAERMLETPRDKIMGKKLWDVFNDATDLPSYTNYHRVMKEKLSVDFEDYYAPLNRWYDISAYPSKDGISVYFKDITRQKKKDSQLQESLKEKETLLAEIHHRVKNNLAVVSGMIQLQAFQEDDESLKHKLNNSVSRIKTIANIHELLYQSNSFSRLNLDENIEKLVGDIAQTYQPAITLEIDFDLQKMDLNINQAIPASLIINEVVTNIFKHGFDEKDQGKLWVTLAETNSTISLQITDNGKGLPEDFNESHNTGSLGLQLINTLTQQLDGNYEYESVKDKTHFKLTFKKKETIG